ncbi:hypothetical protein DQ244_01475 [Blastococcus sp. TBT05-19]|uniref:hypothetical protein n=1 Tax=Blastococcus sp. TBT05-19 TaxID=2250581 RepID=UPI000DE83297|nr:hypothetical protein [Blastococcus sp. TBT05-19]RBY94064.1 hypothetical protein DQ244_01475 [Blastococcus sp. TBT05-19]
MLTVVAAWLAVLAVCAAAALFGHSARVSDSRSAAVQRAGLFLSRGGPWLAGLAAVGGGAATGAWLPAAALGAVAVTVVAVLGLGLAPH